MTISGFHIDVGVAKIYSMSSFAVLFHVRRLSVHSCGIPAVCQNRTSRYIL